MIKESGIQAGVALNPATPVSQIEEIAAELDLVLIMCVNPGFGGQKFIENTYAKVRKLKALIKEKGAPTLIEIDGGVNEKNTPLLMDAGADVLVAGNFVFSSSDPIETIKRLKSLQQ
jgi:ribulose-phosphate 3-epimerase